MVQTSTTEIVVQIVSQLVLTIKICQSIVIKIIVNVGVSAIMAGSVMRLKMEPAFRLKNVVCYIEFVLN